MRTLDRYNADRLVLIADQVVIVMSHNLLRGALVQRTAHPLLFLLAVLFILSACASGNTTTSAPTAAPAVAPTQAPAADAAAPTQAPAAAGPVDPRTSEPCAVLNAGSIAGILGSSLITTVPLKDGFILTCSYEFDGQKRVDFEMDLLNAGREAYDKVIKLQEGLGNTVEPVTLGDVAAIRDNSGNLSLYMVVNGWYTVLYGYGVERQALIDIGRLLTDRVIAFTPTSLSALAPTAVPGSGTLIDMEVVIEAPPEMAGTTKLSSLNIIPPFAGFAMCSFTPSANPFIVTFAAPPGQDPPTPVATFSLSVSGGVTVNQPTPATFEIGLGRSDNPQMFTGEGTVVVAPDGRSGTFETTRLKGRWSCTFAD